MIWKKKSQKEDQETPKNFLVDGIKGVSNRREIPLRETSRAGVLIEKKEEEKQEFFSQEESLGGKRKSEEGKIHEEAHETESASASVPIPQDILDIEDILSSGIEEIYFQLPSELQKEFKTEGEKAARTIYELLNEVRVKAGKILKIIIKWLKKLPGVNRLFVEQDAKIKLDHLLEWRQRELYKEE